MIPCPPPHSARLDSRGGCPYGSLGPLQLGILLHQLLQAEARKLYSNLGFFALSFALIDGSFSVFGMADFLAGRKAALASGHFYGRFRDGELFATRGAEL